MEVRDQFHNRPDLVAQDGKTTLKDCIIMASNGEPIPPSMDVIPDSNKCVAISTKSSVREMIAPGAYAILAPLFVGFLVGPRCLVGMLAGGIGSGAMVAIRVEIKSRRWRGIATPSGRLTSRRRRGASQIFHTGRDHDEQCWRRLGQRQEARFGVLHAIDATINLMG